MRFVVLDVIRTVAIILLISSHLGLEKLLGLQKWFGIPNFYWVSFGGIAVTLFLILSGIVLELNYGKKILKYSSFLIKRFLKIYSIYYLSLIVGILVYFYSNGNFFLSKSDLFGMTTGFYAFIGKWGGPFVGTSWFIGLIITMYLLYPFLSKIIKKRPHLSIVFLLILSSIFRFLLGKYRLLPTRPLDWFPLCRVFEFGLGIYFVNVLRKDFWFSMNNLKKIKNFFLFVSDLSFPLFLIHYPLLFLVNFFTKFMNHYSAIVLYLAVSIIISQLIILISKKFLQKN